VKVYQYHERTYEYQQSKRRKGEIARDTPYNHSEATLALRSSGENQLVTRSEKCGASPTASSSADLDDSASSSMESNETYGSVAALFSYEPYKEGLAKAFKGGVHQESMPRFGFQGDFCNIIICNFIIQIIFFIQSKQPMGNKRVGAPTDLEFHSGALVPVTKVK
jgi:hypothetical protein